MIYTTPITPAQTSLSRALVRRDARDGAQAGSSRQGSGPTRGHVENCRGCDALDIVAFGVPGRLVGDDECVYERSPRAVDEW